MEIEVETTIQGIVKCPYCEGIFEAQVTGTSVIEVNQEDSGHDPD